MDERRLGERLRDAPLPGEAGARERGWRVVRAAFVDRERVAPARHRPRRLLLAAAGVAAVLAIVLSPAGAKVADVFRDVTGIGKESARPELSSLPAPGRLLVGSAAGTWVVNEDGSQRLLGRYDAATWSPRGLFVAAAQGRQLAAVEPATGTVHWTVTRPRRIGFPAWSPSGFRIAYRSGGELRLVDGDGTADRLLARGVAPLAPVWRPLSRVGRIVVVKGAEPPERLAFADRAGRIHVIDPASRRPAWVSPPGPRPHQLLWAGRSRLLAVGTRAVRVYGAAGRLQRTVALPPGVRAGAAALDPSGRALALATSHSTRSGAARGEIELVGVGGAAAAASSVFSGPGRFGGLAWSPNGRWLLVAWRDADQWLFIPRGGGKVKAVGHISRQFAPGASGPTAFPRLDGWCCRR